MQCLFALSYSNLNLTCSSLIKMRLQAGVKQHNKLAVQFVSFPKSVTSLHPSIFFFFPLLFPPIQPPASRSRQPTLPEPGSAGGFFLLAEKKTSSNQKLAHKGMNH